MPFDMSVPGKTEPEELALLARLAALVPTGGTIVEVGPLYGRSTVALASSAPTAIVHSIDTWIKEPWIEAYEREVPGIRSFSLEAFRHYTRALSTVRPIQGFSPAVVADWSAPVDLYFEDAVHGNPVLRENLSFWCRHLKPGGILCGHDYGLRFADVKREVTAIAAQWQTRPVIVGTLWALRKPLAPGAAGVELGAAIANPVAPSLRIEVANKKAGRASAFDGAWAGAHLDADRLAWVALNWHLAVPDVDVEYRLGHPDHGIGRWHASGAHAMLMDAEQRHRPFMWFAARLIGSAASQFSIRYRGSYRQIGNGGHAVSGNGDWASDGVFAKAKVEGAAMTSLAVEVIRR